MTQEELARPSITEVWEMAGGQVLGQRSGWASAKCFLHDDKTPSASVSEDLGKFKCFSCGEHGDVFDVVMKWQNLETFKEVKEYVARLTTEFGLECQSETGTGGSNNGLRKSAHSAGGGLSSGKRAAGSRSYKPSWRSW